jgi:hypothetical protein
MRRFKVQSSKFKVLSQAQVSRPEPQRYFPFPPASWLVKTPSMAQESSRNPMNKSTGSLFDFQ